MNSRRPVNKISPRMRPSESKSAEPAERPARRRSTTARPGARTRGAASKATSGAEPKGSSDATSRVTSGGSSRSAADAASIDASTSFFRRAFGRNRTPGSVNSSWGLVVGMVVAAVVLTAFAVVAAFRPGVADGNEAFVDSKATQEVSAAADNALKTVYSYDAKTIGGYKDAVHKVVTGKMLTDFDKFADTTVSAVQQAQSTAQATADPIGVTLLTPVRAELLVNLTVSSTKNNVPQESASGPIVLHMEKINGHWLASEISDR
ncbi:type VII secretion protein EccB [Nocardia wallacei]|uniref:type VII secretion protein EccB n=1 Tax=Nocardia wallacei TaxID=480035 RepID=UPI0024549C1C|nr:type VII secretion protein EccB [Nocardia wallacei]